MKHLNLSRRLAVLGGAFFLLVSLTLARAETGRIDDRAAFAKLKTLAGEWHGTAGDKDQAQDVTVQYKVIAAGSAVLETLFPGTPHEMVTVYYLDKKRLVLTHYCAAGNQPRMALSPKSLPDVLIFDFAGGSNLNPKKDIHMHSGRIRFDGPDSIRGEWIGYQAGKEAGTNTFILKRKPA